ncbi:MAG: O-antigen ligase family protein [Planctomycetaceae bacterium]|nr:O-antigen ligase family protein [Planctomycetaceae bacterium]
MNLDPVRFANGEISKITEDWLKIFLFSLLIITSIQSETELKILLTGFCVVFFIYLSHSLFEYHFHGRHVYRMGTYRMIGVDESMNDPNSFGASIVYAIPMLIPLWHLRGKTFRLGLIMKTFAVLFFLLALFCIIRTGSRGAFVGAILVLIILAVISRHRIRWLLTLCIAAPIVWVSMGENLQNRYLTIIDPSRGPKTAQESLEGRRIGVQVGIATWKRFPVFGVGPGNSPKYNPLKLQLHNFYAQVIAELGTIGVLAFLIVVSTMIVNFWQARKYYHLHRLLEPPGNDYLYSVSIATIITLFELLLLGTGAHNAYRYNWVWYTAFQGISVMLLTNQLNDAIIRNEK